MCCENVSRWDVRLLYFACSDDRVELACVDDFAGIGLADVVAEKQEPAAVELTDGTFDKLTTRLSNLDTEAARTLKEQVCKSLTAVW